MGLITFFLGVVTASLSGVLMPGPVTATTILMGARNRWAGALIAVGHGVVEFPLMVVIVLGMKTILASETIKMVISLAGPVGDGGTDSPKPWDSGAASSQREQGCADCRRYRPDGG